MLRSAETVSFVTAEEAIRQKERKISKMKNNYRKSIDFLAVLC